MVTIASIFDSAVGSWGGTLYLIGAAIATLYLASYQTDPRIRDGWITTVLLWLSAMAIIAAGVIGLVGAF